MLVLLAVGRARRRRLRRVSCAGCSRGAVAFAVFFVLHLDLAAQHGLRRREARRSSSASSLGWLGWGEVLLGLFLGFLYGAVIGIVLIATRVRARRARRVPFGPFLAAGALTAHPRRRRRSSTGTAAADAPVTAGRLRGAASGTPVSWTVTLPVACPRAALPDRR